MAATETGAASYRVSGKDEDDDKRSTHHRGGRAGAHKIQVWHDRQGQHQERDENQGQETGGQGSAGREDKKKAGAASGRSKDNAVNRHARRLP